MMDTGEQKLNSFQLHCYIYVKDIAINVVKKGSS